MTHKTTIVSAFISNINKSPDRSIDKYIENGNLILQARIPKVIFVDEDLYDEFKERSNEYTKIVKTSKEEIYLYEHIDLLTNFELFTKNPVKDTVDFMFLMSHKTEYVKKAIEMKPKQRVDEFKNQMEDSKEYALKNDWCFKLMTEDDLGMNYNQIRIWADDYRTKNTGIDYHEYRKENNRKKAKKHYYEKIASDKVNVYCEYCKENHSVLRKSYYSNIKRNVRYICEKEGGHISGSKPKPHLIKENPYAKEGKKQCKKCIEIKLLDLFSKDKSRRDGYRDKCKNCESLRHKEQYESNKLKST